MLKDMESRYDPKEIEPKIYKSWEENGYFTPEGCIKAGVTNENANYFSIVLPPPNVTGTLHMGHAMMLVVEDIMVRFARMNGRKTLWIPGTDHAAIATQSKVEEQIYKKEGKTRHDLGRDAFLNRVNQFAKESHDTITNQIRRMGASVDWSREAFTLDEARNLAVRTAFKNMYDDGLIYQGHRIVNWDPKLQTTVSDDEIERVEEKSAFYYLKYGPFVIGTARPETKFGDKYVVMHPDDERYKNYKHGDKIHLEWINGPISATIIKDSSVDMSFGTGVMTITPWHDATDFEIAERHKLDKEQIIDLNGKLLSIAGEFAGTHIKKARPLIIEKLKSKGLVEKIDENYTHAISTNSRGGGIIEPQIIKQWFIGVNRKFKIKNSKINGIESGSETTLKEIMRHVVESSQIKIIPERFEKEYYRWIDNLRDWCISRQIWYGHRIPVWHCLKCKEPSVNLEIKSNWFLVRHGETDFNKNKIIMGQTIDAPLNETGRAQAQKTAELLKAQKIDLVISSDLNRTKETAEIIAKETGAELVLDKAFRERNFGDLEGKSHDEYYGWREEIISSQPDSFYHTPLSNGESYKASEERAMAALKEYLKQNPHKNVVIVTHGGIMRVLAKNIRNLTEREAFMMEVSKNAEAIKVEFAEACKKCGGELYEQDPDTLDTWFSSGLWTFSTLGWPNQTDDLKNYHPTTVLETGYDILFFWVARMILMTGYNLGDIPFKNVYLHGLVRDDKGRKMSKSLGNIIDPLTMADKYGADATRLSLIIGTAPGNDSRISEDKIRGYRNFTTKIWNASRFVLMNYKEGNIAPIQTAEDKTNLAELEKIKKEVAKYIEEFDFNHAGETLYHYFWHTFADKIIESAKPRLSSNNIADRNAAQETLLTILKESLKMLHPFIPYVTEEIWSKLPGTKNQLIIEAW